MMRKNSNPLVLLVALLTCAAPAMASVVIDSFTGPLPPNDCLIDSHKRVVFAGVLCDGEACPPGIVRSGDCNLSSEPGPAGVIAGASRDVLVDGAFSNRSVVAQVLDASGVFDATSTSESVPLINLSYHWDVFTGIDLVSRGVDAVQFTVGGGVSPSVPLAVTIFLGSESGLLETHLMLTAPGPVVVPFNAFDTQDPAFDPRKAAALEFVFEPCFACLGLRPATHFTLSGLEFRTGAPVATRKPSWGQVKSIYR